MEVCKVLDSFFFLVHIFSCCYFFNYSVAVYLQVLVTGFRSLPLFADTPNAVCELTIASNVLHSDQLYCLPTPTSSVFIFLQPLLSISLLIQVIEADAVSKS